jgi:hypothetical protein
MPPAPRYQVYGLDETYPELGKFTFKVVLNPRFYKTGEEFDAIVVDSARKPMIFDLKKWGRKLNLTFRITPDTADGVSTVTLLRCNEAVGKLTFWVIKP